MRREEFAIDTPGIEYVHVTQSSGDYVLFCGDDKKYWLCSLRTKKSMEIDVPAEMRGDLTISLAKKKNVC